jgi:hypothetical protein
MSSTYPNFDKFCVITAIPKSEVGSLSGLEGTPRFYRRWWMSKGDSLCGISKFNNSNVSRNDINISLI